MQLKTITAAKDSGLPGLEFIKTDKTISEVVIGKVRIRSGGNYSNSLVVLIEQPFEEAKRWRLTATIVGFDPKVTYHADKYEADRAASKVASGAVIAVDEVTVLLTEDGEVASCNDAPAAIGTASDNSDDIGF